MVMARNKCKIKKRIRKKTQKTHVKQTKKPLGFYIILFSWSPLVEVLPLTLKLIILNLIPTYLPNLENWIWVFM
jgi:hypothetical protein